MAKETFTAEYIYNKYTNLVEPRIKEIESMVAEGMLFGQIANELGVSNSLLWAMRQNKSFIHLREAFNLKQTLVSNVEMSLYRKAVGFWVDVQKPIKVKKEYYNKNGKKCMQEDVKVVTVKEYIQPDTNAIKFLLINKDGNNYHAETQKPVDNTMDVMLQNASSILVKVKEKANEVGTNDDDSNDA